jgi:hypothetical protein
MQLLSPKGNYQGCHADDNGQTDGQTGRTMAAGSPMTWTHYSVLRKLPKGKTLASARTRSSVRMDKVRPRGSTHPRGRAAFAWTRTLKKKKKKTFF